MDTTHLNALNLRLSHERGYLAVAKSEKERDLRRVWIKQAEKEIADERRFLGIESPTVQMTDDELMKDLTSS